MPAIAEAAEAAAAGKPAHAPSFETRQVTALCSHRRYAQGSADLGCSQSPIPHVACRITLTKVKIAPLEGFRKLLNRKSHVSAGQGPATQLDSVENDNGAATQQYAPPPGPPPGRQQMITAADGSEYTEAQLLHLVSEVKDYQLTHGSLLKIVRYETESCVPARPVGASVLPTAFPKKCFDEALAVQYAFNELYVRVASDPDWLYSVLQPLIEHDEFIAALWNVYVQVRDAGALQEVVCGILRSDYMLHQPSPDASLELKQVEINTFSCAGACHAERIANMHHRLGRVRNLHRQQMSDRMPENRNTQSIVQLLCEAHGLYGSTISSNGARSKCVLMTVQPYNFNIADERPIQYGLWHIDVPCYRCEWQALLESTVLEDDRTLLYRPPLGNIELEVSVVYYRGGYEAFEYRDQSKDTRLRLEMSKAIKCPDMLMHLTTCKSVQQALSLPGAVERFLPADQAERVRRTFMSMQTLDDSKAGLEVRAVAQDPTKAKDYVLKPNRDGGGHNIYRSDIPTFLSSKPVETWQNHVLMRLIEPPPTTGTLMMLEQLYHGQIISELGVLGTCLWERNSGTEVRMSKNDVAGWTFKTKPEDVDEMSVVKGYGCFDCPWLTD